MATLQASMMTTQQRFERLCCAHNELREDFEALLRCLERHGGVVKQPWMHSERFSAKLKRYPLAEGGPVPTLVDTLAPKEVISEVLQWCGKDTAGIGKAEMLALKETSTSAKARVEAVQAEKIYVFGGEERSMGPGAKSAECLDPRTGHWAAVKPMRLRRLGCIAAAIGGRIHVCGGLGEFDRVVETYAPKVRAWNTMLPAFKLSVARMFAAGAVIGGRLYVIGGEDHLTVHRSVEYFEPGHAPGEARGGMLPGEMKQARRHFAAAALPGHDKALVVTGGRSVPAARECSAVGGVHSSAELFDISGKGAWKSVASMVEPRMAHSVCAFQGSVYALGGASGNSGKWGNSSTVEHWDAQADVWHVIMHMPDARSGFCSVAGASRVYILGGTHGLGTGLRAIRSGHCFMKEAESWEDVPDMRFPRNCFSMAVVKLAALAL